MIDLPLFSVSGKCDHPSSMRREFPMPHCLMCSTHLGLDAAIRDAEEKAFDSLSRYKFMMFGYWAAIWVHLNRIEGKKRPSPFKALVMSARSRKPTT